MLRFRSVDVIDVEPYKEMKSRNSVALLGA
jgi:hypothetical protein